VIAMLAMVVVPAAITLNSVRVPGRLQLLNPNPSPYGYTWSLLLFIIPIAAIAFWFLPGENVRIPRRAFWWTIGVLVPLGCLLDLVFAQWFFVFPNRAATLGINAPALGSPVPIEEYVFYTTGFIAILLLYVWFDEFWLAAYNVADYPGEARQLRRLFQFHPTSLILGLALIAAAIAYKKLLSGDPSGFPGYFTVLVLGAMVPAVSFFPTAQAVHQLASPQPYIVSYRPGQSSLGSDSGDSLWVVGLPAKADDRHIRGRMVGVTDRSRMRVDRGNVRDRDSV
jgi:hypothetical protein